MDAQEFKDTYPALDWDTLDVIRPAFERLQQERDLAIEVAAERATLIVLAERERDDAKRELLKLANLYEQVTQENARLLRKAEEAL